MSVEYPDKKRKKEAINHILDEAFGKEEKKSSFFKPAFAGFAAAIVLSIIVGTNFDHIKAFAEKIGRKFTGTLDKNDNEYISYEDKELSEYVQKDVFKGGNEHMAFEITEMLTDGANGFFIMKYSGLDDIGKKWIKEHSLTLKDTAKYSNYNKSYENTVNEQLFEVSPYIPDKNYAEKGINWSLGHIELMPEYCTDNEYYYSVSYDSSGIDYGTDALEISYSLCDDNDESFMEKCTVQVEKSLPFTVYRLSGKQNDNYSIDYLLVSGMSFILYGKCDQIQEYYKLDNEFWGFPKNRYLPDGSLNRHFDITFVYDNDSFAATTDINCWGPNPAHPCAQNHESNLMFACGTFPIKSEQYKHNPIKAFEPEGIKTVVIDTGVYRYELRTAKVSD
ncbi:MAG: hypothetical protein J6M24_03930 [Lachnospiraceae bacterium]|nr:hypothetical protein [Lachnospiraceae bacterium]